MRVASGVNNCCMRVLFGIASHASVSQRKQWQGITGMSIGLAASVVFFIFNLLCAANRSQSR
jgi:hypothetical protein